MLVNNNFGNELRKSILFRNDDHCENREERRYEKCAGYDSGILIVLFWVFVCEKWNKEIILFLSEKSDEKLGGFSFNFKVIKST